ncbi:ATP-binding protein [Leptolyngbya sp. 7M]|uniref:DNA polymerase III subunit n=1 Tax=Leptolyngbya sp. 7M TaxID=2812896 RepID=UPI001B8B2FB2|nr:DNA polymerase III subunit delta' [Leptolyngbya sp. 7M]QYO66865.1 DNA polymerase III subunit delta' [Leptolyngbya sp. 7M]
MFDLIAGNTLVKTILSNMARSGRVPNSLIFAGPPGVGKKLFAYQLAKASLCLSQNDATPCGICHSCIRVVNIEPPRSEKGEDYERVFIGFHLDVCLVAPFKRNIRVGSIRAVESEANFRPFEGKARFFIVDDADLMNDAASNALLKTLEEPVPTSHIILITSRPDSLLPTIRSRAQLIRFAPISSEEIRRALIQIHAFNEVDASLAARFANGSFARALAFDPETFSSARERMLSVVAMAANGNSLAELLLLGEKLHDQKNKDRFEEDLGILESLIRDAWLMKLNAETQFLENSDLEKRIFEATARSTKTELASWLNEIEGLRRNFAVNINRKIATDALFVKMAA